MSDINFKTITLRDLAAIVNAKFTLHDIQATLVGGACVSIYSNNRYQSYDLDFITFDTRSKVKKALSELGFDLKGKYFVHPECPYFIEFVSPPVAVGDEIVCHFEVLSTPLGKIQLLTASDCVKDRLASFFHWNDRQALEQAIMVFMDQQVDLQEIKHWAVKEKQIAKFEEFLKRLSKENSHKTK